MDDREERIRQRASELWESADKPEDRETEFRLKAEREIEDTSADGPLGGPSPPPTMP
jgi:hypothetical protein